MYILVFLVEVGFDEMAKADLDLVMGQQVLGMNAIPLPQFLFIKCCQYCKM